MMPSLSVGEGEASAATVSASRVGMYLLKKRDTESCSALTQESRDAGGRPRYAGRFVFPRVTCVYCVL